MKIYHICSVYKPSNGILSVLKNLVPEQRKLGNEVIVLNVRENGYYDDEFIFCSYNDFKRLIKSNAPDLVIFHGVFYKSIITFSSILRKHKIPYLIELHGALSKQNIRTSYIKKLVFNTLFLNHIIKKASGIIYLNKNEQKNSTITKLNCNDLLIPNGCNPNSQYAKHANRKLELIFLGRLDKDHKGLDVMIPAVKKAYKSGINLHLSIYGRGYKEELEWIKEETKDFTGIIDYYGEIYGEDKKNAFLNSDALLLTSRYEGFPITVLEALSYGVPCIVTPATNVADIIDDNKCGLVAELSEDRISEAIILFSRFSKDRLKETTQNCIEVASKYTWSEIAKQSLNAYSQIITK